MKRSHYIVVLAMLFMLAGCFGTDNKTDESVADQSFDDLTKNPAAKITHQDGWTIVSKIENGDRVYWFLAPEVDNVSPAMFKKIVYTGDKSELETKTVSQCEAPKQTCDDLMKQFKKMGEFYN